LVSVNLSQFILAVVLHSAALCMRLRNILRKWFVTTVLTLPTRPATRAGPSRCGANARPGRGAQCKT